MRTGCKHRRRKEGVWWNLRPSDGGLGTEWGSEREQMRGRFPPPPVASKCEGTHREHCRTRLPPSPLLIPTVEWQIFPWRGLQADDCTSVCFASFALPHLASSVCPRGGEGEKSLQQINQAHEQLEGQWLGAFVRP